MEKLLSHIWYVTNARKQPATLWFSTVMLAAVFVAGLVVFVLFGLFSIVVYQDGFLSGLSVEVNELAFYTFAYTALGVLAMVSAGVYFSELLKGYKNRDHRIVISELKEEAKQLLSDNDEYLEPEIKDILVKLTE